MISWSSVRAYEEAFPGCRMRLSGTGDRLLAKDTRTGKIYEAPLDESDAVFLDRIERSKKAGRNLFFEEWEGHYPGPLPEGAVN